MRDTKKYPQNEYNITIYLSKEDREKLNALCQVTGLSCGKTLTKLVHSALPKAKLVEKTYVVQELIFE